MKAPSGPPPASMKNPHACSQCGQWVELRDAEGHECPTPETHGPAADHGLELAAACTDTNLETVLASLDRAQELINVLRRTLDHDEGGLPFHVSHNDLARCHYKKHESGYGMVPVCHCRLQETIDEARAVEKELADATKVLEAVQQQLGRLAERGESK